MAYDLTDNPVAVSAHPYDAPAFHAQAFTTGRRAFGCTSCGGTLGVDPSATSLTVPVLIVVGMLGVLYVLTHR